MFQVLILFCNHVVPWSPFTIHKVWIGVMTRVITFWKKLGWIVIRDGLPDFNPIRPESVFTARFRAICNWDPKSWLSNYLMYFVKSSLPFQALCKYLLSNVNTNINTSNIGTKLMSRREAGRSHGNRDCPGKIRILTTYIKKAYLAVFCLISGMVNPILAKISPDDSWWYKE